jgi:hypothetical protein
MAVYYRDNRARQKMLDNKAIYKRLAYYRDNRARLWKL